MATGALEESKAGKGDRECWGEPLGNSGGSVQQVTYQTQGRREGEQRSWKEK